eukprot:3613913-Amphidinium_carterae.1
MSKHPQSVSASQKLQENDTFAGHARLRRGRRLVAWSARGWCHHTHAAELSEARGMIVLEAFRQRCVAAAYACEGLTTQCLREQNWQGLASQARFGRLQLRPESQRKQIVRLVS